LIGAAAGIANMEGADGKVVDAGIKVAGGGEYTIEDRDGAGAGAAYVVGAGSAAANVAGAGTGAGAEYVAGDETGAE